MVPVEPLRVPGGAVKPLPRQTLQASPRRNRRPGSSQLHRSQRILGAAALLGAVLFAGAGGFAQSGRAVEPLPQQFDRALVAAGLGINEVMVSGHRFTTDSEIYGALGLEHAGSLLRFDVKGARQRIEALPWVRTADVARILPDILTIRIEERRPTAIWEHGERVMLVDQAGRVLANLAGGRPSALALTRIAGAGAPRALARLLAALEPHTAILSRLELARRVGERRWTLEFAGGTSVHLPADREGEALLRLAALNERSGLFDAGAQVIDLRQDGVIAVRVTPATPPAARAPGIRSFL